MSMEQKTILSILNRAAKISVSVSNEINKYSVGYGSRESEWICRSIQGY